MSRLPQVLIQLFDFPEAHFELRFPNEYFGTFRRTPEPLESWLEVGFRVYATTTLTLAGAENVRIDCEPSTDGGLEAGLHLRTMRMNVAWGPTDS